MSDILLELRSDMCAASGRGYSHTVDTDICTDEYGLPMIPARRLKGCLRDAAVYYGIDPETVNALFGRTGSAEPGALYLENGYLKDRAELIGEGTLPAPEEVTHLFTGVRTQTAIDPDTGTARAETLRTTRVVNEYLPYGSGERTAFVFRADCPETYRSAMETICNALRGMGSGRTRGLGAVRAEFRYQAPERKSSTDDAPDADSAEYELPIHLRLRAPLLLPDTSDTGCSDYISGTMLRGALAGLWCKKHPAHDAARFDELFLCGLVSYGNLYISDRDGTPCEPIPGCIGQIKDPAGTKDGAYSTIFDIDPEHEQLKPLRGIFADAQLQPQEVRREETFHHVHSGNKLLYTQTAVSAGQYYYGTISGPRRLLVELQQTLDGETLRLGRSRTAQYAACELLPKPLHPVKAAEPAAEIIIQYGVFTLVSDAILYDENGINTVDPQALISALLPDLGYTTADVHGRSTLGTKLLHGYNAKRGLRELPRLAFSMGSTLCIKLKEQDLPKLSSAYTIGEHTAEGFGKVHFRSDIDISDAVELIDTEALPKEPPRSFSRLYEIVEQSRARSASVQRGMELFAKYGEDCLKVFTASFVGRAILMAEQAQGEELSRRIDSVKDTQKSETLMKLFAATKNEPDQRTVLLTILRMCKIRQKGVKYDG